MVAKTLDVKLARIHTDPHGARDFILADAKDADMALAIGAPGRSPEAHGGELRYRSLAEYRAQMVQIVEQGLVDIMLMSASACSTTALSRRPPAPTTLPTSTSCAAASSPPRRRCRFAPPHSTTSSAAI